MLVRFWVLVFESSKLGRQVAVLTFICWTSVITINWFKLCCSWSKVCCSWSKVRAIILSRCKITSWGPWRYDNKATKCNHKLEVYWMTNRPIYQQFGMWDHLRNCRSLIFMHHCRVAASTLRSQMPYQVEIHAEVDSHILVVFQWAPAQTAWDTTPSPSQHNCF